MILLMSLNILDPRAWEVVCRGPAPVPLRLSMAFSTYLVQIVSGVAMLRGYGWGRYLYVFWLVLGFAVGAAWYPMSFRLTLESALFSLFVVYLLFRPAANAYFRGNLIL